MLVETAAKLTILLRIVGPRVIATIRWHWFTAKTAGTPEVVRVMLIELRDERPRLPCGTRKAGTRGEHASEGVMTKTSKAKQPKAPLSTDVDRLCTKLRKIDAINPGYTRVLDRLANQILDGLTGEERAQ